MKKPPKTNPNFRASFLCCKCIPPHKGTRTNHYLTQLEYEEERRGYGLMSENLELSWFNRAPFSRFPPPPYGINRGNVYQVFGNFPRMWFQHFETVVYVCLPPQKSTQTNPKFIEAPFFCPVL